MAVHQHATSGTPSRAGLTLFEVMVAVVLLSLVMTGVLGSLGALHQGRQNTWEREKATEIVRFLAERLQAAPWDTLRPDNQTSPLTWSAPRLPGTNTWMGDEPSLPDDRRMTSTSLRLLDQPSGLTNLRVFLEYFRTVNVPPVPERRADPVPTYTALGLYDAGLDTAAALANADLTPYRYTASTASLGEDPLAIRLTVTWGDVPLQQHISILTARSK